MCHPTRWIASTFLFAAVAMLSPGEAVAQVGQPRIGPGGIGLGVPVKTKTINGEITGVSRRGLTMSANDKEMPLPMDRRTEVRIEGKGDPGFVQPGSYVNVWGQLTPQMTVSSADFRVHVEPKKTAQWGRRINVYETDPQVNFVGRVVSAEPFVVQSLDTFVPTKRTPDGQVGRQGKPISKANVTLDLYVKKPETVNVTFGADPSMAAVGDDVAVVIREDRPKVASRVTIRKTETATSPAKRARDAADKSGEESDDKMKKDDAMKDAEAAKEAK